MSKRILKVTALATLLCGCTLAKADDYLRVYSADGDVSEAIPTIAKITFGDTSMAIVTETSVVEIAYDQIESIKFDLGTSGMQALATEKGLKVSYANSQLQIAGANGAVDMAVFNIAGKLMMSDSAFKGTTVDVSALPSGVYLAKINNTVVKFIK